MRPLIEFPSVLFISHLCRLTVHTVNVWKIHTRSTGLMVPELTFHRKSAFQTCNKRADVSD